MSQTNELLESLRAKRAERTAQRKEQQRRTRLILIGVAAAVVVLTVILCLVFIRPAPATDPTDNRFTISPKDMFVLKNVDAAKELYLASSLSDDEFRTQLQMTNGYPDLELDALRKHARDLYDLIRTSALPNHPNGVSAIYYNPANGQLELLYDVDGVAYHFLVNCTRQSYEDTPALIYGHRFSGTYFAMYKIDGKFFADFSASGKLMALCIRTDDAAKINFTDFSLRAIAY